MKKKIKPGLIFCIIIFIFINSSSSISCAKIKKDNYSLKNYLNSRKYPYEYWQTSDLKKEGMNNKVLGSMLKYIDVENHKIYSILIIKNGYLIFERYGKKDNNQLTPDDTFQIYSTTKSVISSLIGIAIEQNYINDEYDKIIPYFKDYTINNLSNEKKEITIKDILVMRSGIPWDMSKDSKVHYDINYVLNKKMETAPGEKWHYNSGSSHLLSGLIYHTTGLTPLEYADKTLFKSLKIKNAVWKKDSNGIHYGGWGLIIKPRDMAKFGLLYLNKGKFEDRQIVPEEWVEKSVKNHSKTYWSGEYGYHWWIPEIGGFGTRGLYGQNIFVIPGENMVVTFTSHLPADRADRILETIMKDYVIPACME